MESSSESNRIQVSVHTAKRLKKLGYKLTFRGLVSVKVRNFIKETKKLFLIIFVMFLKTFLLCLSPLQGKGEMETFWLDEGPDNDTESRKRSSSGFKNKFKNIFN